MSACAGGYGAGLPRHFLTGEELSSAELHALLDRALALKADPTASRVLERPHGRAAVRAPVDAHAHVDGGRGPRARRPPDGAARERAPAHARGVDPRHGARVLAPRRGDRTAHGQRGAPARARRARAGPGREPALARPPPVPGARRPADAARGVRRPARARARLRRRRQQRRPLARDPRHRRRPRGARRRPGGAAAPRGPRRAADRGPGGGGGRRRRPLHRRLGLDGRRRGRGRRARREALAPYRLDDALLDLAAPGAIALHCLPAHPGEEITEEVLYGARQRIWDQAENRRHAQKALLELLVG